MSSERLTRRGIFALLAGAAAAPLVRASRGIPMRIIREDFIPAAMFPTRLDLISLPVVGKEFVSFNWNAFTGDFAEPGDA